MACEPPPPPPPHILRARSQITCLTWRRKVEETRLITAPFILSPRQVNCSRSLRKLRAEPIKGGGLKGNFSDAAIADSDDAY